MESNFGNSFEHKDEMRCDADVVNAARVIGGRSKPRLGWACEEQVHHIEAVDKGR